jgi:hypothetical protein
MEASLTTKHAEFRVYGGTPIDNTHKPRDDDATA